MRIDDRSSALLLGLLMFLVMLPLTPGCGGQGGEDQLSFGKPLPPVIEPVPEQPVPADEGEPGVWESIPGVEPPARLFFVAPEGETGIGGVVLVPSKWGLSPEARDFARRLAAAGFVVAAPDIYEGLVPQYRLGLEDLQLGVSLPRAEELIGGALERLKSTPRLKGRAMAAVGTGVGGSWAFAFAKDHPGELDGVALDSTILDRHPESLRGVEGEVLLLVGSANMAFPPDDLDQIREAFAQVGVDAEVRIIAGAGTDLFNPRAIGYSEQLAETALRELIDFLTRLGSPATPRETPPR